MRRGPPGCTISYHSSLQLYNKFMVTTLHSLKISLASCPVFFLSPYAAVTLDFNCNDNLIPGPSSSLASSSETILTLFLKPPTFPVQVFSIYLFYDSSRLSTHQQVFFLPFQKPPLCLLPSLSSLDYTDLHFFHSIHNMLNFPILLPFLLHLCLGR